MDATPILDILRARVPGAAIEPVEGSIDMPTIQVEAARVLDVLRTLRDDPALQFSFLVDLTAVDLLPAEPRYSVVYHLACLGEAFVTGGTAAPPRRLRVKAGVTGAEPRIASATPIYPAANWLEREVFDLFGISFNHHPDLRRLLTPEDWTGHPLRKDYPVQVRKAAQSWSPIQLSVEEFAENMRAQRAKSDAQSGDTGRSRD